MPINDQNRAYFNRQVLGYDGTNLGKVKLAMELRMESPAALTSLLRKESAVRRKTLAGRS